MRLRDQLTFGVFVLAAASSCSSAPGAAGAKGGAGGAPIGGAGSSASGAAGAVGGAGGSTGGAAGAVGGASGAVGGAAGAVGGAGGAVGGAGGTSDSNVCGARDVLGPHLHVSTSGVELVNGAYAYDGVATVEGSTNEALLLAYTAPESGQTDGGAADPDAGHPPAVPSKHVSIRGLEPMPLFPLGATTWLSLHLIDIAGASAFYTDPWSIAVREREGGALLFGAALNPFARVPSPVPIGSPTADCVDTNYWQWCTQTTATMTYQALTVQGDAPVVIHDSQPGKVSLGGVDYDVRLTARSLGAPCALPSANQDGIGLDIQASDLATRVAGLGVGSPP